LVIGNSIILKMTLKFYEKMIFCQILNSIVRIGKNFLSDIQYIFHIIMSKLLPSDIFKNYTDNVLTHIVNQRGQVRVIYFQLFECKLRICLKK
jgi:hypothetical protein